MMIKIGKIVLSVTAVGLLAGCAGQWDVEAVRGMSASGTAFQNALKDEYVGLAQAERDEADWGDTAVFLERARLSAQGIAYGPERIQDRRLPAEHIADLEAARNQLVTLLDGNARTRVPEAAARAQAMYECWMQEAEENIQPEDIAACRDAFELALAQLEPPPPPPMPEPAPEPMVEMPGPFVVYFAFDSATLTAEAMAVLRDAAIAFNANTPTTVLINGYTDTAGTEEYNARLSERRARAVADAMIEMGVPGDVIMVRAFGESDPAVPTGDGTREAQNRRVVIGFVR